jgi:porin
VRFAYKPDPQIVIRAAILDGVPVNRPDGTRAAFQPGDGALLVSEVAFLGRPAAGDQPSKPRARLGRFSNLPPYDDKFAIGAWHYTASYDDLSALRSDGQPVRRHGSSGAYMIADRLLSRDAADADKRTTAFLQLGVGDPQVSRFAYYLGAGVAASGAFGRPATDELGLGIAIARNGSHFIDSQRQQGSPVRRSEIAIELTYLTQVTARLALQPDLQYIINPNTNPGIRDALAFMLRFELSIGQ